MKELISFGSSQNIFKISGIKHFQSTRCLFNFEKSNFYEAALRSSFVFVNACKKVEANFLAQQVETEKKKALFSNTWS